MLLVLPRIKVNLSGLDSRLPISAGSPIFLGFSMSSKKLPFDVLIIGGGMAGISAASRLLTKKPSLRVGIVEARDRIGGRIHSIWRGKSRLDLGANWIHGVEGNPLMDILPEKRSRPFGMFPIIGPDGRPIENKRSEAVLATLFGVPHRMAAAAFALPSEAAEKISAADWLRNDKLWRKQVGQEPCACFSFIVLPILSNVSRTVLDKFAAMFENVEAAKCTSTEPVTMSYSSIEPLRQT